MFKMLVFAFVSVFSFGALGQSWQLDSERSSLYATSIKRGDVAETHEFKRFSGTISSKGAAQITIDIASLDTGIDIRNQRVFDELLLVKQFPNATFKAQVDLTVLKSLAQDKPLVMDLAGDLTLNEMTAPVNMTVVLATLGNERFSVTLQSLYILNARAFGLTSGVLKLQRLARLPSIDFVVPISFYLEFNKLK